MANAPLIPASDYYQTLGAGILNVSNFYYNGVYQPPINNTPDPSNAPPASFFIPAVTSNTIQFVQEYINNICVYFDTNDANFYLPNATSSLMIFYVAEIAYFLGYPEYIFTDISRNIQILADYANSTNNIFQSVIREPTTASNGSTFGPPLVKGLPWNITSMTDTVYQTLRVLYTAFSLIGYQYQHHHIPGWTPPFQPTVNPYTSGPIFPYTTYFNYNYIIPNIYSQPNVQMSNGVDCTDFTAVVYYLAIGLYFSEDTSEQAGGNFVNINGFTSGISFTSALVSFSEQNYGRLSWSNFSQSIIPLTAATVNNCNTVIGQGVPVVYVGAIVVENTFIPYIPLQNYEGTQVGDIVYVGPVASNISAVTSVTHGTISLGYPYIIDSDNFFNNVTGVFIRNVERIIDSGNTVLTLHNIFQNPFLVRRFIGMSGSASPAPSPTTLHYFTASYIANLPTSVVTPNL